MPSKHALMTNKTSQQASMCSSWYAIFREFSTGKMKAQFYNNGSAGKKKADGRR